jgi:Flp pilus assembly protein TadG
MKEGIRLLRKASQRCLAALRLRLVEARRGSIAVIAGVGFVPLIVAAGLAVDYVRLTSVRSELQRAVDAAALAGARVVVSYPVNDPDVIADARQYFWSNFRSGVVGARVDSREPVVSIGAPDRENVSVVATAEVPVIIAGAVAALLPNGPAIASRFTLSASATAQKYQRGMEVVLALDTTASMAAGSRLANLKSGASDLLEILYGAGKDSRGSIECATGAGGVRVCTTSYSLLVGVVPFVATVNVSPARARSGSVPPIVDGARVAAADWNGGHPGTNSWKGCVMARPAPFEEARADATPTVSPFEPYLWRATPDNVVWGGTVYVGPNPWALGRPEAWPDWPSPGDSTNRDSIGWGAGRHASGPNKGCGFPILPLQPSKTAAIAHIDSLQVGASNGTTASLGFSWAWRLLSPDWRPWWEGGSWSTFRGSARLNTETPIGSPRNYDSGFDKVVVLFTDGQNEMGNGTPDSVEACCTSAYGEWGGRPLGSNPIGELNRRTVEVCSAIKARGVKIFVVLLYPSPPPEILNTFNENGCASGPTYFFNSPTGSDLRAIFREIGAHLTNLRLVN